MNEKIETFKKSLKGKKIAVVGIGISNIPIIKLLCNNGADVVACDKKEKDELGEICGELTALGAKLCLGEGYLDNLDAEIIFKTPGMRYDLPEFQRARQNGSIVTSEMEVFFDLCPAQIIAVTGSDGKTTTTTLIYELLIKSGYTVWKGGNIGSPILGEIENINPTDKVVLELSSFQLHTMRKSPPIAVITNVTPNHLDIHKDIDEYICAKKNIMLYQQSDGILVTNYDNKITRKIGKIARGKNIYFSIIEELKDGFYLKEGFICYRGNKILNIKDIKIPGMHNVENYMAAIAAVWECADRSKIIDVAKSFGGVEHRIEFVRELDGIKFYNDSIASSPARTTAGLNSFNKKLILIAGGYDKKLPFDKFGSTLKEKVKKLILIGQTAEAIKSVAISAGMSEKDIFIQPSLESAVKKAKELAVSGDIVSLSPACASFDMFKNFEERGNIFKNIVNSL